MYNNTSELRRKLYTMKNESGTLGGTLGLDRRAFRDLTLDSKSSGKEICRSAKDIAAKIQLKGIGGIQKTKEIANDSKVKCLKWYTMATNFILILVCVVVLADRVNECLSR